MKVTVGKIDLKFPFDKYCKLIFAVPPAEDLAGIREIRFVDTFSHRKTDSDAFAQYLKTNKGRDAAIEIHIPNIVKGKIHEFTFKKYPEVAGLLLSQVIFNEVAKHVYKLKRKRVKKEEIEVFAAQYTTACYYLYLSSRKPKILSEYRRASEDIIDMDEQGRIAANASRDEIIAWLEQNKGGIPFP